MAGASTLLDAKAVTKQSEADSEGVDGADRQSYMRPRRHVARRATVLCVISRDLDPHASPAYPRVLCKATATRCSFRTPLHHLYGR
ncbi:unnamed protein product [Arctia plantaginis]|uniref:Uncharacterized protein n=1 Tax=Arctia plantaginis TaxID=874455 RepID=A0A8S0ZZ42_ARCPL|nr:unnamed protein product [Arctia plantaginis]